MNAGSGPPAGAVSRRTIRVGKRRVRLTLEHEYWTALAEIAGREDMSVDELLAATGPGNLASAIQAAVGATEERR